MVMVEPSEEMLATNFMLTATANASLPVATEKTTMILSPGTITILREAGLKESNAK
jgi:hypothetical protein